MWRQMFEMNLNTRVCGQSKVQCIQGPRQFSLVLEHVHYERMHMGKCRLRVACVGLTLDARTKSLR